MSTTAKQVMDIRTSKGVGASSNEELRNWTDRGWDQAMKEGNYDRSRERLNFEIQNGRIIPIQKSHSLPDRMAENLAARGIKDPNEGLVEPKYRTVVNFIFFLQATEYGYALGGGGLVDHDLLETMISWLANGVRITSLPS